MNPRVSKLGRSFKYCCMYMSRPKLGTKEDRLGFVQLNNFPIAQTGNGKADSDRAAKIMAFTATNWEEIQRTYFEATNLDPQKEYKRPSRPVEKPVYSYALRFHPDDKDKITPELLEKAARGTVTALGLDEYQSVFYEHTDFEVTEEFPEHPSHIHVVANTVHPLTGAIFNRSKDYLTLSRFCEKFAQEHGLKKVKQRIVNNEKRSNGELVFYKGLSRAEYERFKKYRAKTPDQIIKEREFQQKYDLTQFNGKQAVQRRKFEARIKKAYDPPRLELVKLLDQHQRTITLDHMGAVFKVFARLKQRISGELRREKAIIASLERNIKDLDGAVLLEKAQFEERLSKDRDRINNVHAAQLKLDRYYLDYRERIDGSSDGESEKAPDIAPYIIAKAKKDRTTPDPSLPATEQAASPTPEEQQQGKEKEFSWMDEIEKKYKRSKGRNPDRPKRKRTSTRKRSGPSR